VFLSKKSIASKLANFVVDLSYEELPGDVVKKAKKCTLDLLGCILGACRTDLLDVLRDIFEYSRRSRLSTVFGVWKKTSCFNAAFANSTLANALDFDDTFIGHPGATSIPPSLAIAEAVQADGRELLTAIVAGYEITIRIAKALVPTYKTNRIIRGFGTFQTLGAVSSAGRLLGLKQKEMENAIGIACSNAPVPSIRKSVDSILGTTMVKNTYGTASSVGVMAAMLAQRGFTGPRDIMEGESGFWRMCGSDRHDNQVMAQGLGDRYEILNVEFKPYPACRHFHAAIDAAYDISLKHRIDPEDVEEIIVSTEGYPDLNIWPYNKRNPQNMYEAEFSVPYSVVLALLGIKPGLAWLDKDLMKQSRICRLMEKVKLLPKVNPEKTYPAKGDVIIEIRSSGQNYTSKIKYPKGSPQNPLSDDALVEKFEDLSHGIVKAENTRHLIDTILGLEKVSNVREMMSTIFRSRSTD
jgi:2-methylcitrate dehydratase PrpD